MTTDFSARRHRLLQASQLAVTFSACLLLQPGAATAQRKGFVLNLGIGPAHTTLSVPGTGGSVSTSRFAVGSDFKIGYAPSDRLLIYYSNDASFFGGEEQLGTMLTVAGLSGIGAGYFFKPAAPSFYVQGSLGFAAFNQILEDGGTEASTGRGVALGGGFEFARRWNLDLDLIFGSIDNDFGGSMSIRTVRFGINWLL